MKRNTQQINIETTYLELYTRIFLRNVLDGKDEAYSKTIVDPRIVEILEKNYNEAAGSLENNPDATQKLYEKYCRVTNTPVSLDATEIKNTTAGMIDVIAAFNILGMSPEEILEMDVESQKIIFMLVLRIQHDLWAWHRLSEGWTYGPVKDKANKISPYLKDFAELSDEEVSWDKLFLDNFFEMFKQ